MIIHGLQSTRTKRLQREVDCLIQGEPLAPCPRLLELLFAQRRLSRRMRLFESLPKPAPVQVVPLILVPTKSFDCANQHARFMKAVRVGENARSPGQAGEGARPAAQLISEHNAATPF